jgi:hypothetical protein
MSAHGSTIFDLPCPGCGHALVPDDLATCHCAACGRSFRSSLGYLVPIAAPTVGTATVGARVDDPNGQVPGFDWV